MRAAYTRYGPLEVVAVNNLRNPREQTKRERERIDRTGVSLPGVVAVK